MKNKILMAFLLMAGALQIFSSCKKSFVEADPAGEFLESNYYQTADQVYSGLVAAYNPLGWEFVTDYLDKLSVTNSLGDECYAGGGTSTDINEMQVSNNYTLYSAVGPQQDMWNRNFTGVYRCNLFLQKTGGPISGLAQALQTRYIAEIKCLRAYYYFDLIRFFKNVPLITVPLNSSDFYTVLQAKPTDVYAQIEKDLNDAIPNLPGVVASGENGRVTQGAAMAMLGKVILYENDNTRMQEAASWFEKVNSSGVYRLLPSFASIFDPANKFNSESIFEITHYFNVGNDWSNLNAVTGNIYVNMVGPRSYSGPTYYSAGWSFNPVIPSFQQFMHGDPRYPYTVLDIDSLTKATGSTYTPGYANTGFFLAKFAPLAAYASTTGVQALNFPNDYIEIRLADTYLMEAEALVRGGGNAGTAQSYLDKVRARVGLPSVPATLDNIYNERRLELATEGHRWFDLVRTGQAGTALKFKGFTTGKNELLPIPLNELNNTKMVQNPNYN
jgi:hypothetical protein